MEKKLTLRETQSEFIQDLAKLITWAFANGYQLTGGELYRTKNQQYLYYFGFDLIYNKVLSLAKGIRRSKTMKSKHLDRLAQDLNLFINVNGKWKLTYKKEEFKPLGEYWESLNDKNIWGGRFNDTDHFQRNR